MSETLVSPTFLSDWQAAEIAAVDHMRVLGFIDARPIWAGADGGIDAQGSEAAAQVKFYANPVGRPEIQRLRGQPMGTGSLSSIPPADTPRKHSPTRTKPMSSPASSRCSTCLE
jgi:hypothetical protein